MKKLTFLALAIAMLNTMTTQQLHAQAKGPVTPFRVGSTTLSLGIGVGSEYKGNYYNAPLGMKAAVEWGIWHAGPGAISLGVETGVSFSNGGYYDNYRSRTAVVAMRSAWHYGWKVRGLDTYAGIAPGIGFHHYDYRNNNRVSYDKVIPVLGAFIGASYFVAPRFGFNAEAGYDITNFQAGVIFKLK